LGIRSNATAEVNLCNRSILHDSKHTQDCVCSKTLRTCRSARPAANMATPEPVTTSGQSATMAPSKASWIARANPTAIPNSSAPTSTRSSTASPGPKATPTSMGANALSASTGCTGCCGSSTASRAASTGSTKPSSAWASMAPQSAADGVNTSATSAPGPEPTSRSTSNISTPSRTQRVPIQRH